MVIDGDRDGYPAVDDCDDDNSSIHPGAAETCGDTVDSDCDGFADGGAVIGGVTLYPDADADGHGAVGSTAHDFCTAPPRWAASSDDCDDANPQRAPGLAEVCADSIDNDCDLLADGADPGVEPAGGPWYLDGDADGYGNTTRYYGCDSVGISTTNTDCDDVAMAVNPGATEICNTIDDDCDGLADALDPDLINSSAYYLDADHDGYGLPSSRVGACSPPTVDYVMTGRDCNDSDVNVNPGVAEVCGNATDDDCDGQADGVRYVPDAFYLYPEQDVTALFTSGTPGAPATIDVAQNGRIDVCPGTYYVRLRPGSHRMKVVGLGLPGATILDGAGGTVLVVPSNTSSELQSLTVRGGTASQMVVRPSSVFTAQYSAGGGIFCSRTSSSFSTDLTLTDVIVEGNSADLGGGVFVDRCKLVATNLEVRNNTAAYDGAGLYIARSGSTTLGTGTTIHDNTASGSGGGLFVFQGGGSWTSIGVSGNSAQYGGGFAGIQPSAQVASATFDLNVATIPSGGTVYLRDATTTVSFTQTTFGAATPAIAFGPPVNQTYSYVGATTVVCSTATSSCQ